MRQLTEEQVQILIQRAMEIPDRGLGHLKVDLDTNALEFLVNMCNGDARIALNALEFAVHAARPTSDGTRKVTLKLVEDAMQRRAVLYDKAGDQHYDVISAFIKSVRGSHPGRRSLLAGQDA